MKRVFLCRKHLVYIQPAFPLVGCVCYLFFQQRKQFTGGAGNVVIYIRFLFRTNGGEEMNSNTIVRFPAADYRDDGRADKMRRSEEHTSELQSLMRNSYAVFCL